MRMVDKRANFNNQETIKPNPIISRTSENVNATDLTMNLNNNSLNADTESDMATSCFANDVNSSKCLNESTDCSQINSNPINSTPLCTSTVNSNCTVTQNPINSVQSSINQSSSSIQPNFASNQPASNLQSSNLHSSNPPQTIHSISNLNSNSLINSSNTTGSNFAVQSNNATTIATTVHLTNCNSINGNNPAGLSANLPLNSTVPASCPTANNLINQTPIQITQTGLMNTANNSVPNIVSTSNVELQDDDSEDESEILEESPCGRWLKRREEVILIFYCIISILANSLLSISLSKVEQRDIPGIDATFLAMDTEEGVEVVWNEVRFSEKKYFNSKEETICEVFDRLILLNHPNIVKLHKYWIDKDAEKARIIFITEYMSSGSVKLFLKKTKKNEIKMSLEVSRSKTIPLSNRY